MGARQRRWAHKAKWRLLKKHGYRCADCGDHARDIKKRTVYSKLEFHVLIPDDAPDEDSDGNGSRHHHTKMDFSWRISYYRKQDRNNNLQVLCTQCHGKQSTLSLQIHNIITGKTKTEETEHPF